MTVHQWRGLRVAQRLRVAQTLRAMAVLGICLLSGCSLLRPGQPTAPALLPTRTLAPLRTALPITPPTSPTPQATSTVVISSVELPTAAAAHIPSQPDCIMTKQDAASLVSAPRQASSTAPQISYVNVDGNIALIDPNGRNIREVTTDANTDGDIGPLHLYTYPTFSSDGQSLAFVGYSYISGTEIVTQSVFVAPAQARAKLVNLYTTTDDNIPYVDWSPDDKTIAFLTINTNTGAMNVVSRNGGQSTVVEEGSSAYWQWRNDSSAILAHVSGSPASNADAHISIVDVAGNHPARISSAPGNFKSPSYSPNGRYMLFVARTNDNDDLVLADAGGKPICALAPLESGASFAWSPDGRQVAWIESALPTQSPAPVYVLDLVAGRKSKVHDDAIAFFWSPDSQHLAVYSIVSDGEPTNFNPASRAAISDTTQIQEPMLRIEIANAATGSRLLVADTYPTQGMAELLGFFDQYSRALTPWSPDGRQLVFTNVSHFEPAIDLVVAVLNSSGDQLSLKRIADGLVAFWSPR